ncbi:hypothetical protein [Phenylobacterium sp.]|uniref:hypothetical protein n=1 Tax=Phenylobacterium sp. TaxID=1871053 RepID=UPI002736F786|nr:hypothetical protein [Phenylobacterium sp.]MDP3659587.1 hypothetical protein [Phenylobacterium sp.]
MKLRLLLIGVAASAMAAGSASAQEAAAPPNMSSPPPADSSSTGIPSADSTKLTGTDAGKTNLPGGEVNADTSARTDGTMGVDASSTTSAEASSDPTATPAAGGYATSASVTTTTVTNGPVPDTAENRAKYGKPMSNAGKRSAAKGN